MTIKLRFALLLSLLLGGFVVAILTLRSFEQAQMESMLAADRTARVQLLDHWIRAVSRALPQFAGDTAQSEELAAVLAQRDNAELRRKLSSGLAAAGVHSLWILRADGAVVFQATPTGTIEPPALPIEPGDFVSLVTETPSPRFFAQTGADLQEIVVRRIQPTRADDAQWLVAGRRWDEAHLNTLAALTEARVSLRAAHENVREASPGRASVELLRPLHDWRGHPLRTLRVEAQTPEIDQAIRADWRQVQLFVTFGLLIIVTLGLALHWWVLRPLGRITESLARETTAPVAAMTREQDELGRVARLVVLASEQKRALEQEVQLRTRAQESLERSEAALRRSIDERARLGRDLHDGVIQSLYAAGMGLAGIRSLLRPDQADAAVRLEQTRAALNETIHDVRNFIIGLEPEALKLQTFSQAVSALLEVMRSMRPFQSSLDIDEGLANRLTLAQRVHALQIAREAVSNALRHGRANSLHLALRARGDSVEFEIVDDGCGFDVRDSVPQGKGLANFAQRAQELGAELTVLSEPGRGTRVKLVFSLLIL